MQTFGDNFYQFARSVDIVPRRAYANVLALVARRLEQSLGASTIAVVIATLSGMEPYLLADWPQGGWWAKPIRKPDGSFYGQAAFAYGSGRPLWIVAEDRQPLSHTNRYVDLFENADGPDIPPYEAIPSVTSVKTSIIMPLRANKEVFGVINIESTRYLRMSDDWRIELEKIADGVAILYRLKAANDLQIDCTRAAQECLESADFVPVVLQRTMFVASSARADLQVCKELRKVLGEYSKKFEIVSWTDPQYGNIIENIWLKISSCTYGACYFSEPEQVPGSSQGDMKSTTTAVYRDNPNVLFEAGILYALRQIKRMPLRKLLLIRESSSAKIPFDLSTEFMVYVQRQRDGTADLEHLRRELRRTLNSMLDDET